MKILIKHFYLGSAQEVVKTHYQLKDRPIKFITVQKFVWKKDGKKFKTTKHMFEVIDPNIASKVVEKLFTKHIYFKLAQHIDFSKREIIDNSKG